MPGLTYTLKADGTPLEKGLNSAKQAVNKFKKDVEQRGPLLQLERENKAERNIVGLATEIANARSGAELLSATLNRTGDIFQNSLATGVVMALGSALFDMAKQADAAFTNFQAVANVARQGMSKAAVVGDISDITQGLKTYDEQLKNIRAEQQRQQSVAGAIGTRINSFLGGPGVQEAMNETEKEKSRLALERANIIVRMNELSQQQLDIAELVAKGDEDGVKALKEKFALEERIAKIRMTILDKDAKEKAIAAEEAMFAANQKAEELRLEKQQEEEARKIADEGIKRQEEEKKESEKAEAELSDYKIKRAEREANELRGFIDAVNKSEEDAHKEKIEQIEDERKAREDADKDAQDRIDKVQEKMRSEVESRLTLEQKIALAKERVAKAQEKADAFRNAGINNKAAEADLAEAQAGLMDVREQKIQRIMGGSTKAAEAARQEKRDARARARAERIHDKREAIKAADAKARGEKPAADVVVGGGDKGSEQVKILTNIEQQMKDLNTKLTVA